MEKSIRYVNIKTGEIFWADSFEEAIEYFKYDAWEYGYDFNEADILSYDRD